MLDSFLMVNLEVKPTTTAYPGAVAVQVLGMTKPVMELAANQFVLPQPPPQEYKSPPLVVGTESGTKLASVGTRNTS